MKKPGGFSQYYSRISLVALTIVAASCSTQFVDDLPNPDVVKAKYVPMNACESPEGKPFFPDDWQKKIWIEKTVKAMRGGQGVRGKAELSEFMRLNRRQVVQKLLNDPFFADTVLDFNMYFLGSKLGAVRNKDGSFSNEVIGFPSAVASAQNTVKNGDYLQLLKLHQPSFILPLGEVTADKEDPNEFGKSQQEIRRVRIKEYRARMQKLLDWVQANPNDWDGFCKKFTDGKQDPNGPLQGLGLHFYLSFDLFFDPDFFGKLYNGCFDGKPENRNFAILDALKAAQAKSELHIKNIMEFEPPAYFPATVDQIRKIDMKDLGASSKYRQTMFTFPAKVTLTNSSTNYNRKRASYILKRFFCDDLTPINVESPGDHGQKKHGDDPSCFACHYKLDPMAGFFKDQGSFFTPADLEKDELFFDDGAKVKYSNYEKEWLETGSKDRKWRIGYIRAAGESKHNEYGENLDDLFRIIGEAPEVRQCLVRRVFQYFNTEDQILDAGYLDYLTQQFNTIAKKKNSSVAFKSVVGSVVLGCTFAQTDPVADRCYDSAPGVDSKGSPPCKVNFLLQKNCVTCHNVVSDENPLDLTKWISMPDGSSSFHHVDTTGKQYSRNQTFEMISDRLSSPDPELRMPKHRYMTPGDLNELYTWSNSVLKQAAKEARK